MAATGFNALASQASVSLINNKGDIGKTFEDLASSDSMRSIVVAMLATGADKGASAALGTQTAQAVKDSALSYAVKFADHLKNQLISNTIHASLSSALEGGEWDRKLLEGVQGAVIGAAAATGANVLGDAYKDPKGALHENFLGHKAAHAALGALTAELSGKDAASGAIGAALGEVVGEIQAEKLQERIKTGELKPEDLNVEIQKAVALSRFVGGATAFAMGGDVLMAAQAAGNAAEENASKFISFAAQVLWEIYALTHEEEIAIAKDKIFAYVAAKMGCSQELVEYIYDELAMGMALGQVAKKPSKKVVKKLLGKGLKSTIHPNSIKDQTTTASITREGIRNERINVERGNANRNAPEENKGKSKDHAYYPAPKTLKGFPKAKQVDPKSFVQGGGKMRARWIDKKYIYEWDRRHGTVEKYNKQGQHLGEFDALTGKELKPADPSRRTEK